MQGELETDDQGQQKEESYCDGLDGRDRGFCGSSNVIYITKCLDSKAITGGEIEGLPWRHVQHPASRARAAL